MNKLHQLHFKVPKTQNKINIKLLFFVWAREEHVDLLLILGVLWPLHEAVVLAGDGPGVGDQALVHGEAELGQTGHQPQPHQQTRLQSRGQQGEARGDRGQGEAVPHHPLPEVVWMAAILPEADITHSTAPPSNLTLPSNVIL